jgi:hypothetical protein
MKTKSTRHLGVKYLLALLLTLFFSSSFAQTTYYWIGATSGSQWTTNTNWSLSEGGASAGVVPGSEDIAVFPITRTLTVTGANINVKSIQVGKTGTTGAVVTFSGAAASVNIGSTGFVVIPTGGTSGIADGGNTINLNGTITVPTGATFTHSGAGKMILGTTGVTVGGGTATLSFGNLELANNVNVTVNGNNSINVVGNLILNSGSNLTLPSGISTKTLTLGPTSGSVGGVVSGAGTITGGATSPPIITFSAFGESTPSTINFVGTTGTTNNLNTININRNTTVNITSTTNLISLAGTIACGASTTTPILDIGTVVVRISGDNGIVNNGTPSTFIINGSTGSIRNVRSTGTPIVTSMVNVSSIIYISRLNVNNANAVTAASFSSTGKTVITDNLSFTRANNTAYTINTNNNLILNSTSTSTASISDLTNGGTTNISISGSVTVQQWITGQRGYRVLSNPFSTALTPSTIGTANGITITGANDVKTYVPSTDTWSGNVSSIAANTPYAVFIRGLASEVTGLAYTAGPTAFAYGVTGTLNGNTVSVTPSATGFTIVGNPFVAPVNSSALTGGTAGLPYYVYSTTQNNSGGARVKSGGWLTVASSSITTPIPTMGVIAYSAGTATPFDVLSTSINTTNAATTGLFGTSSASNHLELQLNKDGNYQDKLFVRLDASGTDAGNERMDLAKLNNDVTNIYTIAPDKARLAVDTRKVIDASIPVGITSTVGNYTFTVADNNLPNADNLYLLDKVTNTKTILIPGATYSFAITADATTQGNNRFELGTVKAIVQDIIANDAFSVKLLGNVVNNAVTVQVKGVKAAVQITVIDMQGKIISNTTSNKEINTVSLASGSGMYLVRVSEGENSVINKVVKP